MKTAPVNAGLNDAQLIESIKKGNEPAMEQLMNRHNSHLKVYLHALMHNSTWEEDALQDTWLKALLYLRDNRYHESGRFSHWLFRLAHTIALNVLRGERPYLHDDEKLLSHEQEQAEVLPEGNDDDEETARSGYNRLEASDKEIVDEHYRGWSFGEIGINKGMKENTARKRYARAMKRIRKYIEIKALKKNLKKVSRNGSPACYYYKGLSTESNP